MNLKMAIISPMALMTHNNMLNLDSMALNLDSNLDSMALNLDSIVSNLLNTFSIFISQSWSIPIRQI